MNAAEKQAREDGEWPPLPRDIERAMFRFDELAHEAAEWDHDTEADTGTPYAVVAMRANKAKVRLRRMIRRHLSKETLARVDSRNPKPLFRTNQKVWWMFTRSGGGGSGARPNDKIPMRAIILKVWNGRAKILVAPQYEGEGPRETWAMFESLKPRKGNDDG